MAASVSNLTSLELARVKVTSASQTSTYVVETRFNLPLNLTNVGSHPIIWSEAHALHLSYRWINEAGEILDREGMRTSIPNPLAPGTGISLTLSGITPDEPGEYRLQPTLVLEGVHWACDISELGWTELLVQVLPKPAWPHELRNSDGGRALRGAFARAELARSLAGASEERIEQALCPPAVEVSEISSPVPAEDVLRPSLVSKVRNWTRRTLGIRNVQRDLELVANAVTRQEQRSSDLHQYLERIDLSVSEAINGIKSDLEKLSEHEVTRGLAIQGFRRGLAAMHADLHELSSAIFEEDAINRSTTLELTHCVAAVRAEVQAQSGKSQGLRLGQQRLASLVDTLSISQEGLRRELEGGRVVVELISTLRNLEKWATSNFEGQFLREVKAELGRVLQEIQGDVELRNQQNSALVIQTDHSLVKLDALLRRQAIPLVSLGLVLLRNRLGLLAIQDDDAAAIAYYLSGEVPEAGTVAIIEQLLSVGDCFLDVGANVGIYSLLAGRKVGRSGKVVAVEPMPSTFNALRTTLAVNGMMDIVDVHECALGAHTDTLTLYSGETSGHSSLLEPTGDIKRSDVVVIKSGDDLLSGARPKIIKIDVEGWEIEVLEGLRGTIERSDELSIILECSPSHVRRKHDSLVEWMERIRSFGLKCWQIDDGSLALHPLDDVLKIDDRGTNLLLSRRLDRKLRSLLKRNDG